MYLESIEEEGVWWNFWILDWDAWKSNQRIKEELETEAQCQINLIDSWKMTFSSLTLTRGRKQSTLKKNNIFNSVCDILYTIFSIQSKITWHTSKKTQIITIKSRKERGP
jgi:hypothetical protein